MQKIKGYQILDSPLFLIVMEFNYFFQVPV